MARKILLPVHSEQATHDNKKLDNFNSTSNLDSLILQQIKNIHGNKINFSIEESSKLLNLSYDFVRERIVCGKINAS